MYKIIFSLSIDLITIILETKTMLDDLAMDFAITSEGDHAVIFIYIQIISNGLVWSWETS